MRNRQYLAKWLLFITCLSLAVCLVQRAVYVRHFFQPLTNLAPITPIADAAGKDSDEQHPGPSPCQLSGCSLLNAQPLFFDGVLPAITLFLALLPLFVELRQWIIKDEPLRAPPLRIHLKNCVFRE